MKMSRATKLIVIVACGVFVVVISAVAIAQGFQRPPPTPANVPVATGFYGGSSGPLPMPPGPAQPVMQVYGPGSYGGEVYILQGNVLYKVQMGPFKQVGALRLVPPPPVHPFGGPGPQPPSQPQ